MAKFPAMPLWTDAYLADCGHLNDAETGRYLIILIHLWRAPKQRFPNDDSWLARKFRRSLEDVKTQLRPLIIEFCNCTGNWISQDRLTREFAYVLEKSKKQSVRAKSRWNKEKELSRGNAPTPTPTPLVKKDSKESKKRGQRIPPDWHISPALLLWTEGQGLTEVEASFEADQFRDYWRSATRNATKLDWDATWRTWIRNHIKRKSTNRRNGDDRSSRLMQMADRIDQRSETVGPVDYSQSDGDAKSFLPARVVG